MKDEEARQVINQLTRQIKYLDVELHRVKNPQKGANLLMKLTKLGKLEKWKLKTLFSFLLL